MKPIEWFWFTFIICMIIVIFACWIQEVNGEVQVGEASWYSIESCLKESGQYVMANGKELRDDEFTCASWDYPFNTTLRITNKQTKASVLARVCDRGPSKQLYRMGRIIDLSKGAFREIANLKQGIIQVSVRKIK